MNSWNGKKLDGWNMYIIYFNVTKWLHKSGKGQKFFMLGQTSNLNKQVEGSSIKLNGYWSIDSNLGWLHCITLKWSTWHYENNFSL